MITSGITSASNAVRRDQRCRDGAEHAAPANAAAATAPPVSRTRSHAGTSARVQPALGQQPPDNIDQLKRRQERIRDRAGAEQRRDQRIAHQIPSSREASVPEDTVRKERIIGGLHQRPASLAGAGPIW